MQNADLTRGIWGKPVSLGLFLLRGIGHTRIGKPSGRLSPIDDHVVQHVPGLLLLFSLISLSLLDLPVFAISPIDNAIFALHHFRQVDPR